MNLIRKSKLPLVILLLVSAAVLVVVLVIAFNGYRSGEASVVQSRTAPAPSAAAVSNPDIDLGGSAGNRLAPDFVLRDQQGRKTSLAQFRGKVIVLAFIDSHCTTICPLTTQSMLEALRLLGPAASQVQLLGVNANPNATSVADVAAYTRAHQMQGRWRFVTGPLKQLKRVWRSYHVYVAAVHNDIDHEPVVFLIDRRGHERRIYVTQMSYEGVAQQAELLAQGIIRLLPGHAPVGHKISLNYLPPLKPTKTARVPVLGKHTVKLGPSHPHLFLFFADWLREDSNLPAGLEVLDHYADVARQRGWPMPVAVDELTTETSSAAARQFLIHMKTKLHAPIAEDVDGRLADGYGVQDLPWFVLTSKRGQILWQHGGWLSATELEQRVHAALND